MSLLTMLLGRKFIIRKMIIYAENHLDDFKDWMGEHDIIPGLDAAAEAEFISMVGTDTIAVLKQALEGVDAEHPISKRLVMQHIALWIGSIGAAFAKSVKLPFISKKSDDMLDAWILGIVQNELQDYIATKF